MGERKTMLRVQEKCFLLLGRISFNRTITGSVVDPEIFPGSGYAITCSGSGKIGKEQIN